MNHRSIRSIAFAFVLAIAGISAAFAQQPSTYKSLRAAWVPADGSLGGLTFTGVLGTWQRTGYEVIARGSVTYPSNSDSNPAIIGGLTVPVSGSPAGLQQCMITYSTVAFSASLASSPVYAKANTNAKTISLYNVSGSTIANSALSGATLSFTCIYDAAPEPSFPGGT